MFLLPVPVRVSTVSEIFVLSSLSCAQINLTWFQVGTFIITHLDSRRTVEVGSSSRFQILDKGKVRDTW